MAHIRFYWQVFGRRHTKGGGRCAGKLRVRLSTPLINSRFRMKFYGAQIKWVTTATTTTTNVYIPIQRTHYSRLQYGTQLMARIIRQSEHSARTVARMNSQNVRLFESIELTQIPSGPNESNGFGISGKYANVRANVENGVELGGPKEAERKRGGGVRHNRGMG